MMRCDACPTSCTAMHYLNRAHFPTKSLKTTGHLMLNFTEPSQRLVGILGATIWCSDWISIVDSSYLVLSGILMQPSLNGNLIEL